LNRELIIQSDSNKSQIALLEEQKLIEFHEEALSEDFLVGDIYLGRVKKVLPGLNAAFVDVGHEKDAFLHYLDLGPNFPTMIDFVDKTYRKKLNTSSLERFNFKPELDKSGKVNEVLKANQPIAVQLMKESISSKGPRLSCELTLAGRFIILVPFKDNISVSKQIKTKDERDRLKKIVSGVKPKNFGVIIRTVAEDKTVQDIEEDLNNLVNKWDKVFKNLKSREAKLYGEAGRASTMLRDLLNESFNKIMVDNHSIYEKLKNYISQIAPQHVNILKHYTGKDALFHHLTLDKQIKSLFGKTVNVGGGSYLVIEHTEAMHVIDVNSGSKRTKNLTQEENALKTNLEAAGEIARQLRLRDMGGIIVLDFIDMRRADNRKQVNDQMREFLKNDRAKHSVLPISKFGIMQITRQRVRPEVEISTAEECPVCHGSGEINPTILLVDEIEREMQYFTREEQYNAIQIQLHPYLYAYLTKGLISKRLQWIFKYKAWLKLKPDESYYLSQYKILDRQQKTLSFHK